MKRLTTAFPKRRRKKERKKEERKKERRRRRKKERKISTRAHLINVDMQLTLILGETLILGKGKRFTIVLDMHHILINASNR